MDFKQLESFVTIAKLNSFSKAAEKLFLTQPTISNHIHILEKELDTVLLNRSNKKVTLTKAGEILFENAINLLNKKEQTFFALNEYKGKLEGKLEISSSTIPEQYFLSTVIKKFSSKYPDVKYTLLRNDTKQVIDKILLGEIDFGLVGAMENNKNLEYINILEDEIVLIAPNNSTFKNVKELSIENVLMYPIIFREIGSGTRKTVETALKNARIDISKLNVIATIEDNETIKKMVESGFGISFMSKKAIINEVKLNLVKEIKIKDIDIVRYFYFVFHKKRSLSPLSEEFKNFIVN
ncbi:selenium metabolism-associated LysR family transcriptional regulator [Helicovermis profundi]|uniref:Selenium metabolism-associated LysR family transcriptional regulator n=1 Tax=Helicovermis profundi TaxID=3065157 RepID=A0AAU9EMG3_9FIRM|nr:selenium metabolism-associated LysR family transcriptional regulator [Clostridia bacterium S502]